MKYSNPLTGTLNNPSVVQERLEVLNINWWRPIVNVERGLNRLLGRAQGVFGGAITSPCLVAAPIWQSSVFGDRRMVQRHIHAATTNVPVGMALPDAPRAKAGHQGAARRGSRGFPPPPSPVFSHRTPYPSRASIHFLIRPGRAFIFTRLACGRVAPITTLVGQPKGTGKWPCPAQPALAACSLGEVRADPRLR